MKRDVKPTTDRRGFLCAAARGAVAAAAVAAAAKLSIGKDRGDNLCWQLDPNKCVQCGNCQTHCVLAESAVKCVHAYALCGYCDLCSGYYRQGALVLDTAAENQLCPAGAIKRKFIEEPYFEYTIDESLCIGCGKCAKTCAAFGNGSLHLQVRHDRCMNCNECAIAQACPAEAFERVPLNEPYRIKGEQDQTKPGDGGATS